jgi:Holliday junction resolvase
LRTPEGKVKDKVVKLLKEENVYYFFPVTGGYGGSGIPDIICCHNGHFIAIECKAGKNKTTPLQDAQLARIGAAGGTALIINEENIHDVHRALRRC